MTPADVAAYGTVRPVVRPTRPRAGGLLGIEDVEPPSQRRKACVLNDDIRVLARRAQESGEVQFATFHTWTSEDEPDEVEPPR